MYQQRFLRKKLQELLKNHPDRWEIAELDRDIPHLPFTTIVPLFGFTTNLTSFTRNITEPHSHLCAYVDYVREVYEPAPVALFVTAGQRTYLLSAGSDALESSGRLFLVTDNHLLVIMEVEVGLRHLYDSVNGKL